ncbi:MAG TPA: RNA 2',3'-cyclic phosphodiesterase, partial [Burkholderiales bacterium]
QVAGRGRAMRRENIHLTLAFLGGTEAALVPDLIALAAGVRFAPIRLPLDRVGYWKHNRIIWCGAGEEPQPLTALVVDLRARLAAAGIRYDPKPFVSLVTLVRDAAGLPAAPAWIPLVWEAWDFVLVSSTRVEGGVTYQVLQRIPAQAG